jgi:hypothetical protein
MNIAWTVVHRRLSAGFSRGNQRCSSLGWREPGQRTSRVSRGRRRSVRIVDDGGEHVVRLGGFDHPVGVLRRGRPRHDLEGDVVLGHGSHRRGQGGQRSHGVEFVVDADRRGHGIEESVETVGPGEDLAALGAVDDRFHDHLLIAHAGDVAAIAHGVPRPSQREGVVTADRLLACGQVEVRLRVGERFI